MNIKENSTNLSNLFNPPSLAVIGASRKRGKIGNAIINNILLSGYMGKIYPINPKEKEIANLRCFPNLKEIGEPVSMAIIAAPADQVFNVVEDCGQNGVKNLVVITAGFKETGKEGLKLQEQVSVACGRYGMRMLGPNCVGLMDTYTPINATFANSFPRRGNIALISQSGAVLISILDWSLNTGVGFSKVVSLGNKGDLTEADFIIDAANDSYTKVILCYLEDVTKGDEFLKSARIATREKPVIVLKSGTSQAGARAASSHTGALAGSNAAFEAAFTQAGIIRANTMAELFELASGFASQPLPRNNRVAIVTNSGGPGILAADSIENHGLKMSRFDQKTAGKLSSQLPPAASIYNPVDILGDARADRYVSTLKAVLSDQSVDSIMVLICPTAIADIREIATEVIKVTKENREIPFYIVCMGGETVEGAVHLFREANLPCFTFPEPAVPVIKGMLHYNEIRKLPAKEEKMVFQDVVEETVRKIFDDVLEDGRVVLLGSESTRVAAAYGLPVAPVKLATTPEEAVEAAKQMGFPVVMKIASPRILHKTDVGGVKIGLKTADEVIESYQQIISSVHHHLPLAQIYGVEVQKMMPKGTELIVGMSRDLQFGPLIAFGLGGIYVNLLKDASFRLSFGLSRREIISMISETKAHTLLRGYRGEKPADLNAIIEIIARTAMLSDDFPEIAEIDINPVFAYSKGACALDIKITISRGA